MILFGKEGKARAFDQTNDRLADQLRQHRALPSSGRIRYNLDNVNGVERSQNGIEETHVPRLSYMTRLIDLQLKPRIEALLQGNDAGRLPRNFESRLQSFADDDEGRALVKDTKKPSAVDTSSLIGSWREIGSSLDNVLRKEDSYLRFSAQHINAPE